MLKILMTLGVLFGASACVTVPAIGAPVEFGLSDVNGEDALYNSLDHAGKPMILDFYFASCPACQRNEPNVKAAVAQFHGDGGQVVQVSIDCEREEWDGWIDRYDVTSPVLNDCERGFAERLGVRSYPTTIVLDANHDIAYRFVGVWSASAKRRIYEEMQR